MIPGFLHRLNAELNHLVNKSTYVNKIAIKKFHFHSPPAHLNYTAWLGGKSNKYLSFFEYMSCFYRINIWCYGFIRISVNYT